jgi:hypothetical protein
MCVNLKIPVLSLTTSIQFGAMLTLKEQTYGTY